MAPSTTQWACVPPAVSTGPQLLPQQEPSLLPFMLAFVKDSLLNLTDGTETRMNSKPSSPALLHHQPEVLT